MNQIQAHLLVTLRLLSTGEGGRRSAISSGYRPNFCAPDQSPSQNTDGIVYLIGRGVARPGEESKAKVALLHPEYLEGSLRRGKTLLVREGGRKVGEAMIDSVLTEPLSVATIDSVSPMSHGPKRVAPRKIIRFNLWFHYEVAQRELAIDYTPVSRDDEGEEHELPEYHAQFRLSNDAMAENLRNKLARLAEYAESNLNVPEIEIEGSTARGVPRLWYLQVVRDRLLPQFGNRKLHATYYVSSKDRNAAETEIELTDAARRLIDNMSAMCEQLAWSHLRERLGQPAGPRTNPKRKVFLSYRKGSEDRRRFVEAISHRLGREGFLPWFDEWEIKAGDSIARELAAGFQDVYAIIVVLSQDYPSGRWAREELETAITKRLEESIRIVPVLYDESDRPELLRSLRYVDCREHSEANFERQFSDVIDALNDVELNPYR